MDNMIYEKLAKALEALAQKYSIPVEELQPIAKMCGTAIAQQDMDSKAKPVGAQGEVAGEAIPEDELAGALGGR